MTWNSNGRFLIRDGAALGMLDTPELAAEVAMAMNASAPIVSPPPPVREPALILDLSNWKLQLPTGRPGDVDEIEQPELGKYQSPYFRAVTHNPGQPSVLYGVRFRAPTNGVTTSGSSYPRSELREMVGDEKAAWATNKGGHHMTIEQAITAVPRGKPHVVAGQIHDANDDVMMIRLEGRKLFVEVGGKDGPVLDPDYELGRRFTVRFHSGGGRTKVYYNETPTTPLPVPPAVTLEGAIEGCYFKAGCYTQSNADKEAAAGEVAGADNYGEVEIYRLEVRHT